jgi:hypothetical protein
MITTRMEPITTRADASPESMSTRAETTSITSLHVVCARSGSWLAKHIVHRHIVRHLSRRPGRDTRVRGRCGRGPRRVAPTP